MWYYKVFCVKDFLIYKLLPQDTTCAILKEFQQDFKYKTIKKIQLI